MNIIHHEQPPAPVENLPQEVPQYRYCLFWRENGIRGYAVFPFLSDAYIRYNQLKHQERVFIDELSLYRMERID